jgi:pyrroloquinoline quinone biosynthesis protein D
VILLADSGQLFTCNETALSFISKLDGVRNFQEIVSLFADEFGTDEATAHTDLSTLASALLNESVTLVKR